MTIEAIIENWLRLRKDKSSSEKAIQQLKKTFHFDKENMLRSAVKHEYAKGLAVEQ